MTNVNFDIKRLDYFINKEIDEVTLKKAEYQNQNATSLPQFEFIKSLSWEDARLMNMCHNSYNDIQSPIFRTSSPLTSPHSHLLNDNSVSNNAANLSFNKSNVFQSCFNNNEPSYFVKPFDNQQFQDFNLSLPALNNNSPPSDVYVSSYDKMLNSSFNRESNYPYKLNKSFDQQPSNASLNMSTSSNEYNSARSSFNASSHSALNKSDLFGTSGRRQIYQVSEEFSPALSFNMEVKKTAVLGSTNNIWDKLDISSEILATWMERLRKYIVQTIFVRVINEIDQINLALISNNQDNCQIGETSLATWRLLCDSRHGPIFDHIKEVLPFVDLHHNQKYLIERIRALGFGSMSAYKWDIDQGSDIFKMDKNNPPDAAILMHFLRTYLDARLPQSCQILDGKTFSKLHFIPFGEKLKVEDYSNSVAFIEDSLNPLHFNVISNGEIFLMKKGPTNVFHAILFFFYCIKISHQGMLRRISIGKNGLNLLWIFDDDK